MINFADLIDEKLKRETHDIPKNKFYPSQLAYCKRQIYFKKIAPKPTDTETLRIFRVGDLIHEELQEVAEETDELFKVENEKSFKLVDTETPLVISGKMDIFAYYKGEPVVFELKSTKSLDYVQSSPKDHHKKQLMLYLKAANADRGFVVYVSKNEFKIVQHEVKYDQEEFRKLLEKARDVYRKIDNGKIPEKTVKKNSWTCDFCRYSDECDVVDKLEIENLPELQEQMGD